MKRKQLLILLVIIFCFLPFANALSVGGTLLSPLIYEPGKTITNHYVIRDTNKAVNVTVRGNFNNYVNMSEIISLSEVKENQFDLSIHFPDQLIPAGTYWIYLVVTEMADENSVGVGSLLSVTKSIRVEVYSNEKEIVITSFDASDINENESADFSISVESRSYQDVNSLRGEISVYDDQNNFLGKINTPEKKLKALATETLTGSFDLSGKKPGGYLAQAVVFYDGKQKTAQDKFKIGTEDLLLKEYTSQLEKGFSEFKAKVSSNWGKEIKNVYAKLYLGEQELLQTPSINLGPWGEGELKGIAKIDQNPGNYIGTLKLFFEDKVKEEKINLTIIGKEEQTEKETAEKNKAEEKSDRSIFYFSLGILLVILLGGIIKLFSKKRSKKKEESKKTDEF